MTLQVGRKRDTQRQRNRNVLDVGKEEQVGLKQSPRHCDLCHPAKHSHQSHRNGLGSEREGGYEPGTGNQRHWRAVGSLYLTARRDFFCLQANVQIDFSVGFLQDNEFEVPRVKFLLS